MKKYCFIICMAFFLACDREEITPRSNPQFSVAFIQDISETGVEFAANIYDFGSAEIIEYGFVYGTASNPRVEYSELVKMEGKPDKFFSLKAVHSMVKGQKYNVAAYIKTTEIVVYSASVSFTSQGSTGFIFEKLEMKDPLYFGDTITVWGSNFSRQISLYQFYIQDTKASIFEVNENNFKVKIPDMFDFPKDPNKPLDFEIRVADKTIKISEKVNFRIPSFLMEPVSFNYIDTLTIEGEFFDSKEILLNYSDGNTSYNIVPIFVSSNKIVFSPRVKFKTLEPEFNLTIRQRSYSFKNFTINQSEIKDDTFLNQSLYTSINIDVINPNLFHGSIHRLHILGTVNSFLDPIKWENGSFTYRISPSSNIIYPRNLKLKLATLGYYSEREVVFSVTDAALRHMEASLTINNSRGISHEDRGYIFLQEDIRIVDPLVKTVSMIATVPDSNFPAAFFLLKHPKGKMYIAGNNKNGDRVMHSFDPLTNSVVFLGNIPSNVRYPNAAYLTDRYLYFEGIYSTYSFVTNRWSDFEETYRFDLQTSEWLKLDNVNEHLENSYNWKSFYFEGNLYSFSRDKVTRRLRLQRFDPTIERWQEIMNYTNHEGIMDVSVIGDYVYYSTFSSHGSVFRINMRNFIRERVSNINFNFNNHLSFQSGNKIYHYLNSFFYEFDPEYFTY